ncbi:MAG: hypothetical protein C6I00_02000 [Nitratiruptor sp.]|nr:hypothetical protein [Nitratiruptor sp.]NPA84062.1 HDOD domain-containing protein [Campylobacterota bacterium]
MVDRIVERIEQLPPIPNVIGQLQNLYYYDDYNTSDVEEVLKQDPNLVANILKIANSPYYGLPREFIEIRQAIAYFGLEQIIEFALATVMDGIIGLDLSFYHITPLTFMEMSQLKSKLAKYGITEKRDRFVVANTAFLSDVSKVLISNYALEQGVDLPDRDFPLNDLDGIEGELFGFDTIEVTIAMFEYWNFDREMIDLLRNFKEPSNPREERLYGVRDVVTLHGRLDPERLDRYPHYKEAAKRIRRKKG